MIPRIVLMVLAVTLLPFQAAAGEPPAPDSRPPLRTLQHSAIVDAPLEDVWCLWTTAEGWTSALGIAKAEVDFRIGGVIRTNYNPRGTLGDDGTITNTILAYEPLAMLTLKPGAPAGASPAIKHYCRSGWTVLRFEPVTTTRTRLTCTLMGFGHTALDDEAYAHFDRGNAWTLKKVQEHFAAKKPAPPADAEALMHRLIGEWAFSTTRPDGSTFRGHTAVTTLYDGKVVHARGSLGDDKGLHPHAFMLAARDPRSGAYKVWNFNEKANYTEGEARAAGPDRLVVDWHTWSAADGSFIPYHVEYTFTGPDSYHFEVHAPSKETGDLQRLVAVDFKRVQPATDPSGSAKAK